MSELEVIQQKLEHQITRYDLGDLDRAIADSENQGFIKVITAGKSDKILGVTIVGQHASNMIVEFVTAMKFNLGLNKILGTIHIYPTFAEANKYAAGIWKKNNSPQGLLKKLQKFHAWRRG